jgi:hypothetical protein
MSLIHSAMNGGNTRFKLFIISVRSVFKARNCWFFTSNCCTGDARDKEAVLRWAQEAPGTDAEQAREFFIAIFEFNYNRT